MVTFTQYSHFFLLWFFILQSNGIAAFPWWVALRNLASDIWIWYLEWWKICIWVFWNLADLDRYFWLFFLKNLVFLQNLTCGTKKWSYPKKAFCIRDLHLPFFLESVFLISLLSQCVEIQVPRSTWYSENHLGRTKGFRVEPHRDYLTETVNFHEYAYKSYYIYS